MLELCGQIRSGEVAFDSKLWDELLDNAVRRLESPGA
jgi:hypothetical protein